MRPIRMSVGRFLWICLTLGFLMGLIAGKAAQAQDLDVTVSLERRTNTWGYDISVLNTSPLERIQSVEYTLSGGVFDTVNGGSSPNVGSNNDGNNSRAVTLAMDLGNGDLFTTAGDIDGPPNGGQLAGVSATVNFTGGEQRTLALDLISPILWSAVLSEVLTPPVPIPIIDGQGIATVTWRAPTQYTDNAPILPGDLKGYVIYWDLVSGVGRCFGPTVKMDGCYGNAIDLPDGAASTTPLTLTLSGDTSVFFAITAYTEKPNLAGTPATQISAYSNEVEKIFTVEVIDTSPSPDPGAPTLESVDIAITCTTDQEFLTCSFTVQ